MNDLRLRAHLAELELTAALLIYVSTVDDDELDIADDDEEPPSTAPPQSATAATATSARVSNVIPFRRRSPSKK